MSWDILSKANLQYLLTRLKEVWVDWKSNGILGAKNLLPYPFAETTHTDNSVVFTDNGDGTVKANNQSTGNAIFTFCNKSRNFRLPKGTYIITGCPSGGSGSTHNIWVGAYYDSAPDTPVTVARDYGSGATFTLTENAIIYVNWNVMSGFNPNNIVCKPMIRLATDTDSTWQPYTMTNRQLTEKAMQPQGHTIKNDAGTSLTQRDNLQFGGVYTHDDSTNGKTQVDIVREFSTVAEVDSLTGEAVKGFQHTPDTVYRGRTASDIGFDKTGTSFNSTRVQDVLEEVDARNKPKLVWSGNAYTIGDEIQLTSYDANKEYLFGFKPFTGGDGIMFMPTVPTNHGFIQFTFWGNSQQHAAYRLTYSGNGKFVISNDTLGNVASCALIEIYERN